jgi:hypothetical protein
MSRRLALVVLTVLAVCPAISTATEPAAPAVNICDYQYFYVDFPRRVRALRDDIALAEAELAVAYDRVESYRPFQSFRRYAATYTAEQSARLTALAAEQRLQCLRDEQIDLWRERQAVAAQLLAR